MTRPSLWRLAVLVPLAAFSCGDSPPQIALASGGMSSGSDRFAVSGGGFRVETGEPTLFYGTVVENDLRAFTYLVLARGASRHDGDMQQVSWGTVETNGARMTADHTLHVQDMQLVAKYTATIERDSLQDRELTIGPQVVATGDWLFLYDDRDPGAGLVPVRFEMPALPREFEAVEAFTLGFVEELVANDETVRAFFER